MARKAFSNMAEGEMWESGEEPVMETGGVTIVVGDEDEHRESVTAADIKEIARENDISRFMVLKGTTVLGASDFPVNSGTLKIVQYNEAN